MVHDERHGQAQERLGEDRSPDEGARQRQGMMEAGIHEDGQVVAQADEGPPPGRIPQVDVVQAEPESREERDERHDDHHDDGRRHEHPRQPRFRRLEASPFSAR